MPNVLSGSKSCKNNKFSKDSLSFRAVSQYNDFGFFKEFEDNLKKPIKVKQLIKAKPGKKETIERILSKET